MKRILCLGLLLCLGAVGAQGTALLKIEAILEMPRGAQPHPLALELDGEHFIILGPQGETLLALSPGTYSFAPQQLGAEVSGPRSVTLAAGEQRSIRYVIRPDFALELFASPGDIKVGDEVTFTARLTTGFTDHVFTDLEMMLPDGFASRGGEQITSPVSAEWPVELEVQAVALRRGTHRVEAAVPGWIKRSLDVDVIQPAEVELEFQPKRSLITVGDTATLTARLNNSGDLATTGQLVFVPPANLGAESVTETLTIEPGETLIREFELRVTPQVETMLTSSLSFETAEQRWRQEARQQVLRPEARLERELSSSQAVAGEVLTATFRVWNEGRADLDYRIRDEVPEWVDPLDPPEFEGSLAAGEMREHSYRFSVRFGPEAEAEFRASFESIDGTERLSEPLSRYLLKVEASFVTNVMLGEPASLQLVLSNPTDHPLGVRLLTAAEGDLGLDLPPERLELQAYATHTLELRAEASRAARYEVEITPFIGKTPAGFPISTDVLIRDIPELKRYSDLSLPFDIAGEADELLLSFQVPEGARYQPASSRLDGLPNDDPRIGEDGRLYWRLPFRSEGVLSFTLSHRDALEGLSSPGLTLRRADREVYLQDEITFAAAEAARALELAEGEGLIRRPLNDEVFRSVDRSDALIEAPYGLPVAVRLNGREVADDRLGEVTYDPERGVQTLAFYGLALAPGRNLLEVEVGDQRESVELWRAGAAERLRVTPLATVADGRSPVKFLIEALDDNDIRVGFGPLTLESDPEPNVADAFESEPGYQILLSEGQAVLELKPMTVPGEAGLKLRFNELRHQEQFFVSGPGSLLAHTQASATLHLREFRLSGFARGFLEAPVAGGTLQVALDTEGELSREVDADQPYRLTGTGQEAAPALRSDDMLAIHYQREGLEFSYGAEPISLPAMSGLPRGTAFQSTVTVQGDQDPSGGDTPELDFKGYLSRLPSRSLTETIIPDGTRVYQLSQAVLPGSEQVSLQIGAELVPLLRLKDYALDYLTGTLTLAQPLFPTAPNFAPVKLEVSYAPANTSSYDLSYGSGFEYRDNAMRLGMSWARLPGRTQVGAEIAYEEETFGFTAGYDYNERHRYRLASYLDLGRFSGESNLNYSEVLRGQARLAYQLRPWSSLAVEHQQGGVSQSSALYEYNSGPLVLGFGVGYAWDEALWRGLMRGAYRLESLRLDLTHYQALETIPSQTQFGLRYDLNEGLAAEADIVYTWGSTLEGSFGLRQKVGQSEVAVGYQLPNASGEGNRARIGVQAPLPLDENWRADISAGLERGLSDGSSLAALGLGVRYGDGDTQFSLGSDIRVQDGDPSLRFNGGLVGSLAADHVLSLEGDVQVFPSVSGELSLAQALRLETERPCRQTDAEPCEGYSHRFSVLNDHSLRFGPGAELEGGTTLSYWLDSALQLRPSFNYRVPLTGEAHSVFQASWRGHLYPWSGVGVGGAVHHLWQPADRSSATAFSLEGSLHTLGGLWLSLGYTFGGFEAFTPDSGSGIYIRADLSEDWR